MHLHMLQFTQHTGLLSWSGRSDQWTDGLWQEVWFLVC